MAKKSTTVRKTAAKKVTAKKVTAKKAAPSNGERASLSKLSTKKSRAAMVITSVVAENPRRAGTNGRKLFDIMARYVKAHPKATVAELIAETDYRIEDFNWDLFHKHIEIKKEG